MHEFGWVDVDAGAHHTLGIRNSSPQGDRDLYTWGNASYGELGTGDCNRRYVPQRIEL